MTLNLTMTDAQPELKPRITVFGVGGAGGNAVNNMIEQQLDGCEFVVANTDAQALQQSTAHARIQMGQRVTEGLGAGARPQVGASAAEESIEEIVDHLAGAHMAFITAGMGGGTGTGAAPIIAQAARELGVLTVGVVTKPFQFEGTKRMRQADEGIEALQKVVDTLIIIPNQNLFRLANEKTTFTEAFAMADDVLYQGVKGVTDLMVRPGLINLDFADVRAVMNEMGKAMMGTGESDGENRAMEAAEKAIANPLLDEISLRGARGVLINVTGGYDLTLFELDEAANRIREEVDPEANIIVGSTLDTDMEGQMRVSVVATGIDAAERQEDAPMPARQFYATGSAVAASKPAPAPEAAPAPEPVQAEEPAEDAAPEPSLFESFDAGAEFNAEPEVSSEDDVPAPAYQPAPAPAASKPAPAPQQRPTPVATAAEDQQGYVAPKPAAGGSPTPEALARLRAAIQRDAPRAPQAAPVAQQQPQSNEHGQKRGFGINSLINRMTGAPEEGAAPAERRQPNMGASAPTPMPQHHAADDGVVDPDQERIEIPAFLRRQAN
ncbi:cell division protein FtsZ [Gymnodinialimonas ceratoperidinii]|uniref:Cell division protein FtsZ n=1 Tax=Gymnodinialimonas ceratoperidinii TaxID=2856823 RepID=A0A8F6U007_9RHOB|nr:cell division protein FtsZ [Gymnodinialimonas ceratoperidinii]QXT41269.1 cell division protein FtsZ [Gymnodinialimonas ceratoperidinii]